MKKILLIIIAGYIPFSLSAQRENIWYFGTHAGLDFNSGSPVPLTNGALSTQEGCASISDLSGNILFYTDGTTVYTRNHIAMPNGSGLNGGSSSTQSSIIVPVPGSNSLYDVFTIAQQQSPVGLNYSQVDMTLNGGNGDVINLNTPVYSSPATEKLTAVKHANGSDVWVAIHAFNSDTFYVYLVTSSGISAPVISVTGSIHTGSYAEMGYMRFSPKGNKLAVTNTFSNFLEIFDFDKFTGIISNPVTFTPPLGNFAYGVEFSADGSKLYLMFDDGTGMIYQLDINAGNPAAVLASAQLIHSCNDNGGALQRGPNGKIYFVRYMTNWIGVINNPNASGALCNPDTNGVMLGAAQICQLGFPNFISDLQQKPAGIEEQKMDFTIVAFPNPFFDILNVSISKESSSEINLYDISSRKILQHKFSSSAALNTEQLSEGVYFYEVLSDGILCKKGLVVKARN